jgi:hypothetical protein
MHESNDDHRPGPWGDPTPWHGHESAKAAYEPPVLTRYGDLRGLTLGGTPGGFDSGGLEPADPFS